jgi:hypothetical protein
MAQLHDRMPVILAEIDWPKWLGEEPASEQDLLALLKPCPNEALQISPVDKMVGNVRNNGPQLILPVLSNAIPANAPGLFARVPQIKEASFISTTTSKVDSPSLSIFWRHSQGNSSR